MPQLQLQLNGQAVTAEVDPTVLMVECLRRDRGLTGTHMG